MELLADTTFLIDLSRVGRKPYSDAVKFLSQHPDRKIGISAITVGEFLSGFDVAKRSMAKIWLDGFPIVEVSAEIAEVYAHFDRHLRQTGASIGSNDLWIACSALTHGTPVLTRNTTHFERITSLVTETY